MSNTLNLTINQQEFDSDYGLLDSVNYNIEDQYTVSNKGSFILAAAGTTYIPFGRLSAATNVRIKSDQPLTLVINGATVAIGSVYDYIANGSYTGLEVTNESATDNANIDFELYGTNSLTPAPPVGAISVTVQEYTTTPIILDGTKNYVRINVSGASTFTLPLATGSGKLLFISNIQNQIAQVQAQGSDILLSGYSTGTYVNLTGSAIMLIDSVSGCWDIQSPIAIY